MFRRNISPPSSPSKENNRSRWQAEPIPCLAYSSVVKMEVMCYSELYVVTIRKSPPLRTSGPTEEMLIAVKAARNT
jgi:hypothetical protein